MTLLALFMLNLLSVALQYLTESISRPQGSKNHGEQHNDAGLAVSNLKLGFPTLKDVMARDLYQTVQTTFDCFAEYNPITITTNELLHCESGVCHSRTMPRAL